MIKRATWFVAGAAAGAVGASYTRRKVRAVATQLAPVNVARSVADRARSRGHDLVAAVREGRVAMRAKEDELRADRDAQAVALIAQPAQIIVLSDVRELERPTGEGRSRPISAEHPAARSRRRSRR